MRSGRAPDRRRTSAGYTMVFIVVALAVMAIMTTVAVQTASFQKRRENEEELIFRGQQIVEGIRLFRARHGRFPVVLEELVTIKPKVLRKAWKDPITGEQDWVPVFLGQDGAPPGGRPGAPGGRGAPGASPTPAPTPAGGGDAPMPKTDARGPIIGVHSRSCDESIKVLDGRTRYCDWKFVFETRPQTGQPPQGGQPQPTSAPGPTSVPGPPWAPGRGRGTP